MYTDDVLTLPNPTVRDAFRDPNPEILVSSGASDALIVLHIWLVSARMQIQTTCQHSATQCGSIHASRSHDILPVPIIKFDSANSSYTGGPPTESTYETNTNSLHATATIHRFERRLAELRLRRTIRRFQARIIQILQRKCEMRRFVILRLQFVCRARNRVRAAVCIQRFVRSRIIRYTSPPQIMLHENRD